MKNASVTALLIGLVIAFFSNVSAQDMEAATVQDFIAKGDVFYDNFDNDNALLAYKKAAELDTTHCEAWWKLARAYIDVGEDSEEEKQKELYYLGLEAAERAVRHGPEIADAQFELSVALGRVALSEGGKTKVRMSARIKEVGEKTIELDPQHDGALHVLARWHREVANLSGVLKAFAKILYGGLPPASNEEAVDYFKRAIAVDPAHINHHLELARTYVNMKEWQMAKTEYDKVLSLPVKHSNDPHYKKEAEAEIETVDRKLK